MDYRRRYAVFFTLDTLIVMFAIYISYWLLHPEVSLFANEMIFISAITLVISHHIVASIYQLYNRAWAVASVRELLVIGYAVTISVTIAMFMQLVINADIYFRVMAVTWLLHIIMIGGSRFALRLLHDRRSFKKDGNLKHVLIVGAGQAGTMLARNIVRNTEPEYKIVGFVDDDVNKKHLNLYDVKVLDTTDCIEEIVMKEQVEEIIIAIPSLNKEDMNTLYNRCRATSAKVKIMPKIEDVMTGKVSVNDMRDVNIEDLLGRDEVKLDMIAIANNLTGKTVLVTGAGGSIGSEICRQVMRFNPAKLILVGHGENSIYTINMELQEQFIGETVILPIIADVQDRERIFEIMEQYRPDVVYHAAAHKHVPLMEYNPREAVKNNVFGTKNVAEAAHQYKVGRFVLVSTDKAVNPPNVMGATKRMAEMVIQELATRSTTTFAAVRFGNVLGSRGSVVPRFKQQIAAGGPVTVTHPDMTRYFMTIPEASRLVLQAGTLAKGGEVFVLDMGEPVKIVDLAKNVIKLSGFSEEDIHIQFSGIRPGEKMYEELLNPEELQEQNIYPKIHVGKAKAASQEEINLYLEYISKAPTEDMKQMLIALANNKVVDLSAAR